MFFFLIFEIVLFLFQFILSALLLKIKINQIANPYIMFTGLFTSLTQGFEICMNLMICLIYPLC